MIKFPIMNIDVENWNALDDATYLFDEFIYSDKDDLFRKYFQNQVFVDCNGNTFKITGKELPQSRLRHWFKFLPNVFKITLLFKQTDRKIDLQEFKKLITTGITQYGEPELTRDWLNGVKEKNSIEEILNLQYQG